MSLRTIGYAEETPSLREPFEFGGQGECWIWLGAPGSQSLFPFTAWALSQHLWGTQTELSPLIWLALPSNAGPEALAAAPLRVIRCTHTICSNEIG